jgi:hypothetical protein
LAQSEGIAPPAAGGKGNVPQQSHLRKFALQFRKPIDDTFDISNRSPG